MKKEILPIKEKSKSYYMQRALYHAKKAALEGEVPVGAVIVYKGHIIASGRNRRENGRNALYHAEIEAINKACKKLSGWRLFECDMYVTLEPCPMCAGAIINSRIKNLYIATCDEKSGCFGSKLDMNTAGFNHIVKVEKGILEKEASFLLSEFFKGLRNRVKTKKTQKADFRNN